MAKGQKTGGRQKVSRNKRTQEREEATAQAIALIGEAIPDAFAGDAHAFLVAVYKNPRIDHHTRQDAAKAALPYEKPRFQAVTLANEGGEPVWARHRCSPAAGRWTQSKKLVGVQKPALKRTS